jgi:hypothetical protein
MYGSENTTNYQASSSNDLTKIERKKTSVVFAEPFISEIDKHETIYSNDLTKKNAKKTGCVLRTTHL